MNALSDYIDEMLRDEAQRVVNVKEYFETLNQEKQKEPKEDKPVFPEIGNILNKIEKKLSNGVESVKCSNYGGTTIYGRASGVPIHNPEDAVEVAIKNNIQIMMPYKSWNAIFQEIGEDALYDAGILDLKQNFYKKKAQELLSCYGEFPLTGGTKYERCCTILYKEPRFDIEIPTEGNRFYRDRGIPMLLRFLKKEFVMKGDKIYTTPETLAMAVGLVNSRFNDKSELLKEVHPKLSEQMVYHFHLHCKPELDKVVFSLLDELQNGYKVIQYQKLHRIKTQTGEVFCSDSVTENIIKEAESYILERDFHTNRIVMVFFKRKKNEFYAAVVKYINQKYNLNWASYRNTVQIDNINDKSILELLKKMPKDAVVLRKLSEEINQRFHERMRKKIHADYDRTNKDADEKTEKFLKTIGERKDYQEFRSLGYSHEDAVDMVGLPSVYRVHKNCYEYQDILMDTIITI